MPEIIDKIKEADTEEEKIRIIQGFGDTKGFRHLLYICYEPSIEWVVTRKDVDHLVYNHMDIPDYDLAVDNLFLLAPKRLFNYTNVRSPLLTKQKVKNLISGHFSVMHHEEVELIKQAIDRNIDGVPEDLVRKAFPNLLITTEETKSLPDDSKVTKEEDIQKVKEEIYEKVAEPIKLKSRNTKSKLDKHQKEIFNMIDDGATQKEISKKYKVAVGTLRNWIKKNRE